MGRRRHGSTRPSQGTGDSPQLVNLSTGSHGDAFCSVARAGRLGTVLSFGACTVEHTGRGYFGSPTQMSLTQTKPSMHSSGCGAQSHPGSPDSHAVETMQTSRFTKQTSPSSHCPSSVHPQPDVPVRQTGSPPVLELPPVSEPVATEPVSVDSVVLVTSAGPVELLASGVSSSPDVPEDEPLDTVSELVPST